MRDSDLWWHLAAGRLIVAGHSVPIGDPWSFTAAGSSWLNHEWLAQCVFYAWVRWFGLEALTLWYFGLLLLIAGVLQDALMRWTSRPLVSLLCTVWAMAAASPFFEIRPHLYNLLGLALLLRWILRWGAPDRWWLPLVFAIWANLHAGVVMGLMVISIWGFVWTVGAERGVLRSSWRRVAAVVGSCWLATALNPQGVRLPAYPLRIALGTAAASRALLEYLPPFSSGGLRPASFPWAIGVFVLALACLGARGRLSTRDVRLWTLAACALLALVMSLVSARFIPLFAIAQAPIAAAALSTWQPAPARRTSARSATRRWALPAVIAVVGIAVLQRFPLSLGVFRHLIGEESFPVEVVSFMERNGLRGKVFAYAGWGGYLQWRMPGRFRLFYDTRADTVFDLDTVHRYTRVQFLLPGWMETLNGSSAEYFLWPRYPWSQLPDVGQARALAAAGGWRTLYADFAAVLLVRSEVGARLSLLETPDSPYKRLALASTAMEEGQLETARAHLERALEMDPGLLPACRNLVGILAHAGRSASAEVLRRRCRSIFPDPATDAAMSDELRRRRPSGQL